MKGKKYQDLLNACCKEKVEDGVKCNEDGTGEKRTRIAFLDHKAPEYFITNFGRMSFEMRGKRSVVIFKNDKRVVDKKITLTSTFKDEEGTEVTKEIKYVLDGYIVYLGSGMAGHYIFIKCDDDGNESTEFNDSRVSKFTGKSNVGNNGYIFSYKKIE